MRGAGGSQGFASFSLHGETNLNNDEFKCSAIFANERR